MANGSSNIPLDTIVTAVIARLFKRVLTGVVGLAVAVGGGGWYGTWNWVQKYVNDQFAGAAARAAVASAPNRLGYLRDKEFFEGLRTVTLNRVAPVTLAADQVERLQLQLNEGRYRVDAVAPAGQTNDVDPLLYLYRLRPSGTAVDAIDVNNDSVDSNGSRSQNSRIEFVAAGGTTYFVEVSELMNRGGTITVRVSRQ